MKIGSVALIGALMVAGSAAQAAEIKAIVTGATKAVVVQLVGPFEKKTGHSVTLVADTAGGVAKRVEAGESFDVALATRAVIDKLVADGRLEAGSRKDIAATSIGVAVKEGAPKPDLSSVAAFQQALRNAKTIAYVDPASGGTSGIYIAAVIDKLGMTEELKPKLRLKAGGYVAELVANGEAELAIHQISELLPVKGVTIVGEIPREIQSVTVYAGGLKPAASEPARAFLNYLASPEAAPVLTAAGMVSPK